MTFQLSSILQFPVTPHVAGESRAEDVAECFKQNLDQDLAGKDPEGLVDWNKLY